LAEEQIHKPVLLKESVEYLITGASGVYFDGTLGFGGHSSEFLKILGEDARLIATDVDATALSFCKDKFKDENRIKIYQSNFSNIDKISKIEFVPAYDGIFADLGVSSFQLDDAEAGFTYRSDAPLDLRLDKTLPLSAADVLNKFDEEEIAGILFKYGEEKKSRLIARKIAEARAIKKFSTTFDLNRIVAEFTPEFFLAKSLSRVFQALRIYVNDEMGNLEIFLNKSVSLLKPGGRLVLLTFHSIEDRLVKDFFKTENQACICPPGFPVCTCGKVKTLNILTRKAVTPGIEEIAINRRARSSKLRAVEKI
jgi:16S rRNA (cytosine1402-N4)-methyltransferase